MTIDEFKRFVEFVGKKSQAGFNPSPEQFNIAVDRAFAEWIMKRYNNPNDYQPGMPIPKMGYQQTQKINDDLSFLITRRTFDINSENKLYTPDGTTIKDINNEIAPRYLHLSSLRYRHVELMRNGKYKSRDVTIKVYDDDELGHVLASSITNPTKRFPIANFCEGCIEFYPEELQRITMTYLRVPNKPVWGFTVDANGRPSYDASTSVDIESPDETHTQIAMGVLSFLGVSIREPFLAQYAEQMKNTGI